VVGCDVVHIVTSISLVFFILLLVGSYTSMSYFSVSYFSYFSVSRQSKQTNRFTAQSEFYSTLHNTPETPLNNSPLLKELSLALTTAY